jgi:hypothetical protein
LWRRLWGVVEAERCCRQGLASSTSSTIRSERTTPTHIAPGAPRLQTAQPGDCAPVSIPPRGLEGSAGEPSKTVVHYPCFNRCSTERFHGKVPDPRRKAAQERPASPVLGPFDGMRLSDPVLRWNLAGHPFIRRCEQAAGLPLTPERNRSTAGELK